MDGEHDESDSHRAEYHEAGEWLGANQDAQAPCGNQNVQEPGVDDAAALVRQADAACKKADMTTAVKKAREALALLNT